MTGRLPGPRPDERPQPDGRRDEHGVRVPSETESQQAVERSVLVALVEHEPGVLANVAGLFSRRQFNIRNLSVGSVGDGMARITLVVEEPRPEVEQARKQLEKQVPVVSVTELSDAIERELALVKVADDPHEVEPVARTYDGRIVDVGRETVTVELTGPTSDIENTLAAFQRFDVREVVRTGTTAVSRNSEMTP